MTDRERIANYLAEAARMLREPANTIDCAAWRIADAAGMYRAHMAEHGFTTGVGIDRKTGRGFLLPGLPDVVAETDA